MHNVRSGPARSLALSNVLFDMNGSIVRDPEGPIKYENFKAYNPVYGIFKQHVFLYDGVQFCDVVDNVGRII